MDILNSIFIKKNGSKFLLYKNEILDRLRNNGFVKSVCMVKSIRNINDTNKILEKYNKQILLLITLFSYNFLSPFKPLLLKHRKLIKDMKYNIEFNLFKMNTSKLSLKKLTIIILSYINQIIEKLNIEYKNEHLYTISSNNLKNLCNVIKQNI